MISLIIPTLNEEKYLAKLLESVKSQDFGAPFGSYEVIIADAKSKDGTLEIAKQYGCKIIPGGLPSKGRNEGAKAASGDLLFFLDADCILPAGFLKNTSAEFEKRKLDIASFCLLPFNHKKIPSFLLNIFYNYPIILLEKILPHAATGIIIKKSFFERLGGFDETITLAEDHYLAREVIRRFGAKFGIIRSTRLFTSDRRFRTDGWALTYLKFLLCELHLVFLGPVRSDVFKYRFNHYNKKNV